MDPLSLDTTKKYEMEEKLSFIFKIFCYPKRSHSEPHSEKISKHEWLEIWSFNHCLLSLGPKQLGIEKCSQMGPKELMVKNGEPGLINGGEI